jgi:hypothetical protein
VPAAHSPDLRTEAPFPEPFEFEISGTLNLLIATQAQCLAAPLTEVVSGPVQARPKATIHIAS